MAQPWLGFTAQPVTSEIAGTLGLDRPSGLIVKDVAAGGPAAQAGIRVGDVVTRVDDFEVNDPQSLRFRVATKGVGNAVAVAYLRGGARATATLRLVRPPENPPRSITVIDGDNPLRGATVANLSPAYAEELQLEITSGVVITQLSRRSLAARLGFRPGDLIVSINGRKIGTVQTLQEALRGQPDKWNMSVERNGEILNLSVRA